MDNNYWANSLQRRLSRRRSLTVSGGALVGSALLAACGSGKGSTGDANSLLTKVVDTTQQAKRGGILKDRTFSDASSLSITGTAGNFLNPLNGKVYNTFLRFKFGYLQASDEFE